MFPNVMALVPVVVCDARWMLLGSGQAESHRTAAIGIFQKAASLQALMSDMQVTQTATVYQKYFNGSKLQHLYAVCIYIYTNLDFFQ